MQQFNRLCRQLVNQEAHPRDVAARPGQADDHAQLDWVATYRKHDRDGRGDNRLGFDNCDSAPRGDEHVHLPVDQLSGQRRQAIKVPSAKCDSIATFWPPTKPASCSSDGMQPRCAPPRSATCY
jgi:hypothetical protein